MEIQQEAEIEVDSDQIARPPNNKIHPIGGNLIYLDWYAPFCLIIIASNRYLVPTSSNGHAQKVLCLCKK
jgi:hypothetical protein